MSTFKSILTALIFMQLFSCAPSKNELKYERNDTEFIIGGQDLGQNALYNRSIVLILNQSLIGSASVCTGTFITPTVIITAAHCVSDDKNDLLIRMGNSIFSEKNSILFFVIAVKKHENYKKNEHDLALIQVEENPQIKVDPVPITREQHDLNQNNMTLLGYGVNQIEESADEFQGAGTLRRIYVRTQQIEMQNLIFTIDQSQGSGACHGDSGGPAFITLANHTVVLAGVASGVLQSEDESECTNQSVYTKVSAYQEWILKNE